MYLHVGSEIARVEFPEYLSDNHDTVSYLVSLILDQVGKAMVTR